MTDFGSPIPPQPARVLHVLLLLAVATLILLAGFPARDLWTPDEPRYMEVAREMAVTGDFLIPHLSGYPYAEKPPLFFWLAAALYNLGCGADSGRLVALLASLATLLLVALYARRTLPQPGPLLAALFTLTALVFLLETRSGVIDPLVTFFVTAALLAGRTALRPECRRRTLWWLAAYLAVALGVLAKGPPALVIPPVVLVPFALLNRKSVRSGWLGHALGLALLAAVVLAWTLPAIRYADRNDLRICTGTTYTKQLLGQIPAQGVDSFSHPQPPWYYLMSFPLDHFPWFLLLPLAGAGAFIAWRRENRPEPAFLLLWFVAPFILFSIISAKRSGYLMPIVPAAGLLLAARITAAPGSGPAWPHWSRRLLTATCGLLIAVCVLLAALAVALVFFAPSVSSLVASFAKQLPRELIDQSIASFSRPAVVIAWLACCAAVAGLALVALRFVRAAASPAKSAALIAFAILAFSLAADLVLVPIADNFKSPRRFCEKARPFITQAKAVCLLKNDMSGVYNLYTGIVSTPILIDKDAALAALRRRYAAGEKVVLIAQDRGGDKVLGDLAPRLPVTVREFVGDREMQLLLNWDPATGTLIPIP